MNTPAPAVAEKPLPLSAERLYADAVVDEWVRKCRPDFVQNTAVGLRELVYLIAGALAAHRVRLASPALSVEATGEKQANPCTCHPDDKPPVPCAQKYALQDCAASPSQPVEPADHIGDATELVAAPSVQSPKVEATYKPGCRCGRCRAVFAETNTIAINFVTMYTCDGCGNKRCPHATAHWLICTGSNEDGQPGSDYGPSPAPSLVKPVDPSPPPAPAPSGETETLGQQLLAAYKKLPTEDRFRIVEGLAALGTADDPDEWEAMSVAFDEVFDNKPGKVLVLPASQPSEGVRNV